MSRAAVAHAQATCSAQVFGRDVLDVYQRARQRRAPLVMIREAVPA
jgi:1,2-diacylglycerol 3-alpha-glucosyltransferase